MDAYRRVVSAFGSLRRQDHAMATIIRTAAMSITTPAML